VAGQVLQGMGGPGSVLEAADGSIGITLFEEDRPQVIVCRRILRHELRNLATREREWVKMVLIYV